MKTVLLASSVGLIGCAHVDFAQIGDSATTAIAITHGFQEANPLWGNASWPAMAAVKIGVAQAVKFAPDPICEPGLMGLTVIGYDAALWNLGVLAGSGIAAVPVAAAVTALFWDVWIEDAHRTCLNYEL